MKKRKQIEEEAPELESEEEKDETALFPGMKIPKDIKAAAQEMKIAETARKEHAEIEKDRRDSLVILMKQYDCKRFQIEIDGQDFEFCLEESEKVKSKRIGDDDSWRK